MRLTIDALYGAETLIATATAAADMSDCDRIAAVAGARAAREIVADLLD